MTPIEKASAPSNTELNEWAAVEILGWSRDPRRVELARPKDMGHSTYDNGWLNPSGEWARGMPFNFAEDENHFRQVLEESFKNKPLFNRFASMWSYRGHEDLPSYWEADSRTRLLALWRAYQTRK